MSIKVSWVSENRSQQMIDTCGLGVTNMTLTDNAQPILRRSSAKIAHRLPSDLGLTFDQFEQGF
jgi:hypothetical protein